MSKSTSRSEQVDRIKKPVGSMGFDPWGLNMDAAKTGIRLAMPLYEKYFRTTTAGIDNVPAEGPCLIIANHSGVLPTDGLLIGLAIATRENNPRMCRAMIERWFPTLPFVGNALNRIGAVVGDPINAAKMLDNGEAVVVFPEGVRGVGKGWDKRYELQRMGNGFVHIAMRHNCPIIPVGVVGCEETMPMFADIKPLAKALGAPFAPVGPLLPLPARVHLNFGEPIQFSQDYKDEAEVTGRVEQVKDAIRALIAEGLDQRESVYL